MNGKEALESLLTSVEKKPRKQKPRYRKPQAIKDFEEKYKAWSYSGRNIPEHCKVLTQFRDDTANGLTKLIIAYLKVQGAFATRLNSTGIYRNDIKKFVPNTQRKGMADVFATYKGKSLNIEVKTGKDRMSEHQLKVQTEIEEAGGYFFIARNFESFKKWFEELVNTL